jgi:transcriptional regulator with XRE-family HTH domain
METVATERIDPNKLREARLAKHMTQRQLAQAAGITNETVNRLERASEPRTVYPLTARKLGDALGVSVSDIRADELLED